MSDTAQLEHSRSVRFSRATDALIEQEAARTGSTGSDVIRKAVESTLPDAETASALILRTAKKPRPTLPNTPEAKALRQAYAQRHQQ